MFALAVDIDHARTIAPEFAYGEDGKDDVVPPNSTIVVEVELISYPKREDRRFPRVVAFG